VHVPARRRSGPGAARTLTQPAWRSVVLVVCGRGDRRRPPAARRRLATGGAALTVGPEVEHQREGQQHEEHEEDELPATHGRTFVPPQHTPSVVRRPRGRPATPGPRSRPATWRRRPACAIECAVLSSIPTQQHTEPSPTAAGTGPLRFGVPFCPASRRNSTPNRRRPPTDPHRVARPRAGPPSGALSRAPPPRPLRPPGPARRGPHRPRAARPQPP
jgi:hypothetical protein